MNTHNSYMWLTRGSHRVHRRFEGVFLCFVQLAFISSASSRVSAPFFFTYWPLFWQYCLHGGQPFPVVTAPREPPFAILVTMIMLFMGLCTLCFFGDTANWQPRPYMFSHLLPTSESSRICRPAPPPGASRHLSFATTSSTSFHT